MEGLDRRRGEQGTVRGGGGAGRGVRGDGVTDDVPASGYAPRQLD